MEIPEMNMISNFEAGVNCLQNPSLISRFFQFPGQQVFIFWKWGALMFAIFATFSSIIRRVKLVLIRFHILKSTLHHKEERVEYREDDEISLASSSDDEQGEEDDDDDDVPPKTSSRGQHARVEEDFRIKNSRLCFKSQWQNGQLRRQSSSSSWSEFTSGKNVVKLWDSLGFNLDFDEDLFNFDPQSVVTTWESDQSWKETDLSGALWNIPGAAPAVFLSAEGNTKGDSVILSGYDSRMRRGFPALYAEWKSPAAEKVAGISTGGVGKVYVRDEAGGVVTLGDVRNVRTALEKVREGEGET